MLHSNWEQFSFQPVLHGARATQSHSFHPLTIHSSIHLQHIHIQLTIRSCHRHMHYTMLPFTLLIPASTASEITEGRELAECWAEHAVETGLNSWSRPAEDPSPRVQGLNSWSRPAEDPSPRVQGLNSWSRPAEDPSPRVQGLNSWSRPAEDPSPRVQGLNSWSRPAEDPSPRVQGLNSWSHPAGDPSPRVQGLNSWSRPAEDPSPRVQGLNSWSRPAGDPSPRVQGLNSWSRPAGDPSPRVHSQCRLCCTLTGWNLLESLGFSVGEKKCLVLDTRFFSWQSEVRFKREWSWKSADCCYSGVSESSFRQFQTWIM